MSTWYEKRPVAESVLSCLGIEIYLWAGVGDIIHRDDVPWIAAVLQVDSDDLLCILYEPVDLGLDKIGLVSN